jgi:hypothetical protein
MDVNLLYRRAVQAIDQKDYASIYSIIDDMENVHVDPLIIVRYIVHKSNYNHHDGNSFVNRDKSLIDIAGYILSLGYDIEGLAIECAEEEDIDTLDFILRTYPGEVDIDLIYEIARENDNRDLVFYMDDNYQ